MPRKKAPRIKRGAQEWDYVGKGEDAEPQRCFAGDHVESDTLLIDKHSVSVGTVFQFARSEGGFVYGSVKASDGTVMEVKRTCGHVKKFIKAASRSNRSNRRSNRSKTRSSSMRI